MKADSKTPFAPFACVLDSWLAGQCAARTPEELPSRLAAAQRTALARTLRHAAAHSAFYARRLRGRCLAPDGPEDLAALPFTTAEDLRPWEQMLCTPLGEVERRVTLRTSGTTGPPKRLAFTRHDLDRTRDFFSVGMAPLVRQNGTLALLLPGGERANGVADLLRQALARNGVAVCSPPPHMLRPEETPALAAWLRQTGPGTLVAMPTQLKRLLNCLPGRLPGITGVLSSAEPLDAPLAAALRAHWGCEVLDHYGLTETGYGCAVECSAHDGYHLRALDVLVEIVDPEDGSPLPANAVGEVVVTTLNREAMPLIRYRTGDLASLSAAPCACGSPLPRLGPVLGRVVRDAAGAARMVRPRKGERAA